MPIYEYRCKACGAVTEILQKMSDKPLKTCAKCSGALEKLISRTSFQLKGGGWYAGGYAGKGQGGGGESSDSSSSKSSSGSEASPKESPSGSSEPASPSAKKTTPKSKSKD